MSKYPNFTPDQLQTIKTPFLVISVDHDLISLTHTINFYTNLPHSELLVVPHSSHIVMMEQPGLINDQIIRFLKEDYRDIDPHYFFE